MNRAKSNVNLQLKRDVDVGG